MRIFSPFPYGKTSDYSVGALTLNVTGWSYQSGTIVQDWVGLWSGGLGVERADSPNHAIDNSRSDYDMLLLCFSEAVSLETVNLGWTYNDSDMSLLALTGGSLTDFTGKVWDGLLSEGWESAGDYYDAKQNPAVNPDEIVAECWLIGAYNSNLGGAWSGGNQNVTKGTDYFKLSSVAVIPEPSALVTVGLASCALFAVLRRRR